jgi:hypothetical protein
LITGPTSILPGAPKTFDVPLPSFVDASSIGACVGPCVAGAPVFHLVFTTNLSLAPSPLELVFVGDFAPPSSIDDFRSTSVTGDAVAIGSPPTLIPEPASLTLVGGALALFLFARRAKQRDRRA